MATIKQIPISGFPEWLPEQKVVEEDFLYKIRRVFQLNGYSPIETPAVERASTLVAKGGNEKEIYKIDRLHASVESSDDSDLALHFDLTVPMARYIAQHERDLAFPFKRYQMQPVWRGERAQAGRFRQFYQCDIDIVGREKLPLSCDAEIPAIMASILRSLDIGDFQIRINNRKILQGFLSGVGIESAHHKAVMGCIDKLEKIGKEEVLSEIRGVLGDESFDATSILSFLSREVLLGDIHGLCSLSADSLYQDGVAELADVVGMTLAKGVNPSELVVDLTIARGLDYYTGTVFETRLVKYPQVGSVCSGGRYEDLVGGFANGNFPGVGMSIGLTRLLSQLFKYEVIAPQAQSYTKLFLISLSDDDGIVGYVEKLATSLRAWDIPSEVSLVKGKLSKQIEYAQKKGVQYVGFIGETEFTEGLVRVKNLLTGEQKEVNVTDETYFKTL